MKIILNSAIALVLSHLLTCSASASLGETGTQCDARYGKSEVIEADVPHFYRLYYSHWFSADVTVELTDGFATYVRFDGPLYDDDVKKLLDENAQGHKWSISKVTQFYDTWKRDDGAVAFHHKIPWHSGTKGFRPGLEFYSPNRSPSEPFE